MSADSRPRRWYLVAGATAIAIAVWLLLVAAGVEVPSPRLYWPIFILPGAIASIADAFIGSRRPSSMGRGVAALGFAGLFFGFTLGYLRLRNFFDWWPALPLIAGLGFLGTYFADRGKAAGYLVAGVLLTGIGLSFWALRFGWLENLLPSSAVAWGILLLLLGVFLVTKTFRGRRKGP